MLLSPTTLTIVQPAPELVASYDIFVHRASDNALLAQTSGIVPDPSGTTVIPIGSNGLLEPPAVPLGTEFNLRVGVIAAEGAGPNLGPFLVPDGPWTTMQQAEPPSSMTVTV